jgi:hypothetical protein
MQEMSDIGVAAALDEAAASREGQGAVGELGCAWHGC